MAPLRGLVAALAVGLVAGVLLDRWVSTPQIKTIVQEKLKVVEVNTPVLVAKDVIRYVQDPQEVERLLREAAAQENKIATLTETIASLKTTGQGPVTYVAVPGDPKLVREAHFKDWRLQFDAVDAQATYTLTQRFEALAAVGKDRAGQPTAAVKLFEIGPGTTRTPLADPQTTLLVTTPDRARWRLSAALQAGVGLSSTLGRQQAAVGVLALPWLRHGSGHAEDSTWAIGSPALVTDGKTAEPGVLPVSVNLARTLPVLADLWGSPIVSFDVRTQAVRLGFVLSATF